MRVCCLLPKLGCETGTGRAYDELTGELHARLRSVCFSGAVLNLFVSLRYCKYPYYTE